MIINKRLLITGCGRSGTTFSSELFNTLGLRIGHEKIKNDGIASWKEAIKPKWKLKIQYNHIFHQVRNPVDCMNSFQTITDVSWKFIAKHIPIQSNDSEIIRYAKYWYYWNKMIEGKSTIRFKVESIYDNLPFLCDILDLEYNPDLVYLSKQKLNSRNYTPISASDIFQHIKRESPSFYDALLISIKKYGYMG